VFVELLEQLDDDHGGAAGWLRPKKSALDAVGTYRQRCWRANWVIDLDTLTWT